MTIQEKQKVAKQKLDECSRTRKQLAADLGAAAAKRGKAEKALAQCAAERAKLTEELRQCAEVDRPAAEKALAKCAKERSMLEAELKQCAEVDRPNAEKALAQCGKDRAKLEAKLAKVVKALKESAGGKGKLPTRKKSSRRRRRRSKKASLSEVEAELTSATSEDEEDMSSATDEAAVSAAALIQFRRAGSLRAEDISLLSEKSESGMESMSAARLRVQRRQLWFGIQALKKKAAALLAKVRGVDKKIGKVNEKMEEMDAKQAGVLKNMTAQQAQEKLTEKALEKVEERSKNLVGKLGAEDSKLEATRKKLTEAMSQEEKAGADLAKEQAAETAGLLQLASLVQEEHRALHESLELSHNNVTSQLKSNEMALEALASKENEEACDAVRADVIKAKAKLEITGTALLACLKAKKEIKTKIEGAVALGKKAEAGLAKCLKNKADLKIKIKMCHERRDAAREKLKACLERKKVLKVQIHKCHEKRDEARKKLAECLKRKKELKEKIAKAKGGSLMQEMTDLEKETTEALAAVHQGNMDLNSALKDLKAASQEEASHVNEMCSQSDAADAALQQCSAEDAEEATVQAGGAKSLESLMSALSDLSSAGKDLEGAANANAANA